MKNILRIVSLVASVVFGSQTLMADYNPGAVTLEVAQTAHGFSVGNWVYNNNGTYTLAEANALPPTNSIFPVGVVSAVADANDFTLQTSGTVRAITGLTANSTYYLSDATPGAMTTVAPTNVASSVVVVMGTGTTAQGVVNIGSPASNALITSSSLALGAGTHVVMMTINGNGVALQTGVYAGIVPALFSGTLQAWSITTDPADTVTVDILRSADGGAAPSVSMVGGGTKPAQTSGVNTHGSTFPSWTSTTISQYDNFKFQITAIGGTATVATIALVYK